MKRIDTGGSELDQVLRPVRICYPVINTPPMYSCTADAASVKTILLLINPIPCQRFILLVSSL